MKKHIVQLIRERFHPLVRFCGPQHAGEVEVEGVRGPVFLGDLSIWLWPAKSTHRFICSAESACSSLKQSAAVLPKASLPRFSRHGEHSP